jgi:hypothetical protein
MARPLVSWDVKDVCNWVEVIGFGQYRRRFAHHSVDGVLLIALTDEQYKSDLGILPLGHRTALIRAVKELQELAGQGLEGMAAAGSPGPSRVGEALRQPSSASPHLIPPEPYLGPALGKTTVYEQRAKLLHGLDKANQKVAQHEAVIEQLQHMKKLRAEEVDRLKGQIKSVEKQHSMETQAELKAQQGAKDVAAAWRPNSYWVSVCFCSS